MRNWPPTILAGFSFIEHFYPYDYLLMKKKKKKLSPIKKMI